MIQKKKRIWCKSAFSVTVGYMQCWKGRKQSLSFRSCALQYNGENTLNFWSPSTWHWTLPEGTHWAKWWQTRAANLLELCTTAQAKILMTHHIHCAYMDVLVAQWLCICLENEQHWSHAWPNFASEYWTFFLFCLSSAKFYKTASAGEGVCALVTSDTKQILLSLLNALIIHMRRWFATYRKWSQACWTTSTGCGSSYSSIGRT